MSWPPRPTCASYSTRMVQVTSRLGEPTKQNAGERRARLGCSCRQAKQWPRESGAKKWERHQATETIRMDQEEDAEVRRARLRSTFIVPTELGSWKDCLASVRCAPAAAI